MKRNYEKMDVSLHLPFLSHDVPKKNLSLSSQEITVLLKVA